MDPKLRDALQASLGSGFRLDRELGGGGMSKVFLATDVTLDRQVVVKVLPAELSAAASADRFRREIQLVARLQHPHVVPIVTAGDAGEALYYVMPFLSGETLRARLTREGPLKTTEAVRILRETLDALAFAHAHGVIHRDIKPENILLSSGHAVVADFGVSKALQDSGALTSVGMTVGTPTYMAPEQAAADPTTDHRADLYAVAIVAYEMLSGAPPFSGTPTQVIKAHFSDAPVPLKQRRSDVPDSLAEVVMRALAKDPGERPQSAEEMIAVLDAVLTPPGGETAAAMHAMPGGGTAGATMPGMPMAPAGAPAPKRSRLGAIVAALVAIAVVAAGAWFFLRPNVMASAQSITITPFSVADGDTALVRLGQNLVTTMSANLDGVGDIHVADPISVLSHARSSAGLLSQDAAFAIARTLNSRSAVVGTLTRAGTNVRAELAMYELASPGAPLVRVSAVMPADSISALTDSLTWGLLRGVWAKGRSPTANASSIDTRSPAALREFLEGERLFSRGGIPEAAAAYERAVAIDTTFWFAHFRYFVARSWTSSPLDTGIMNRVVRHIGELPDRERRLAGAFAGSRGTLDALRTLRELNARYPDYPPGLLAEADLMLHFAPHVGGDAREAIAPFRRLVALMPSDLTMAEHLALSCITTGDLACATSAVAHYDSLVRADSAPLGSTRRIQRQLSMAVQPRGTAWADSVAPLVREDLNFPGVTSHLTYMGAMLAERPDLMMSEDRLFARITEYGGAASARLGPAPLIAAVTRGDGAVFGMMDSLMSTIPDPRERSVNRRVGLRWQALWELQGLRAPDRATAEQLLALAAEPDATPSERRDAAWIAGANAIWRGDTAQLRAQVAALSRDTTAHARLAVRSLRALRLGREGNRAAAAESLLVVEREHGSGSYDSQPYSWTMFAADRVVGAEWLVEAGRLAPADSLLRYTRGYEVSAAGIQASMATYGAAQLLRSRIAEGLGNRADAIAFARIFLTAFDKAGPEAEGRVKEARERITRLGGTLEGLPVAGAEAVRP